MMLRPTDYQRLVPKQLSSSAIPGPPIDRRLLTGATIGLMEGISNVNWMDAEVLDLKSQLIASIRDLSPILCEPPGD